jgi:predicted peptidase
MKQNYKVDANRIYLGGHSMGGSGTWWERDIAKLGGIVSLAAGATPDTIAPIKPTPQLIVHGDAR